MTAIPYLTTGIDLRRYLVDVDDQPGACEEVCPCHYVAVRGVSARWRSTGERPPWSWLVACPRTETPQ